MTGFGRGESRLDDIVITAEIRTLNSRFQDISVRFPKDLQSREFEARELIQKRLGRGKITLVVSHDEEKAGLNGLKVNEAKLEEVVTMLQGISQKTGHEEPITLPMLLHFDEIFSSGGREKEHAEKLWKATKDAIEQALTETEEMRIREGGELSNALRGLISDIEQTVDHIAAMAKERAPEARKRLNERLQGLQEDLQVDSDRVEQEIALLVDRMDINEELVRLRAHCKFFLDALDNEEAVGRRLNFLTQELNRELNTIGAKAYNSEIAHSVVVCKEKVEQMREQVQNIE